MVERSRPIAAEYARHVQEIRVAGMERDYVLLAPLKVIGMTTTGLSKYRALIAALKPKILVIEEAAETREAPITAGCLSTLEQLVLVGDHKQLRPHCHRRELEGQPWNLDISLFERLVNNNVEFTTLAVQRRMIPEVRRLIYPIYKDAVSDHQSVRDLVTHRPPVPGMGAIRTFFFTAEYPEHMDDTMSSYNSAEADMCVGLVNHLVMNGTSARAITIITFYNGQRRHILRKLVEHPNLQEFRKDFVVKTVDSYQGEENDVVILSFVRSNADGQIGFLSNQNRACVALSRARRGMYMFGNARTLAKNPFWNKILAILTNKGKLAEPASKGIPLPAVSGVKEPQSRLGVTLPIVCTNHGTSVHIKGPEDWLANHSGCDLPCDHVLNCGHACILKCHPFPHEGNCCMEDCIRLLDCGHLCVKTCHEECACDKSGCTPLPTLTEIQLPHRTDFVVKPKTSFKGKGKAKALQTHVGKRVQLISTKPPGLLTQAGNYNVTSIEAQEESELLIDLS